ncbi:MAG: cytochrome c3 family protein [Bdellovibrionales bacterium]|nr:cytochrome c3 family protein [Bdellovibrionales bacterium]
MPKKIVGAIVALIIVVGLPTFVYLLTSNKLKIGYNTGYMPEQPIPFSHELHAGTNKMDCKYCHTTSEVSRHASVPSLNICLNCHLVVKADSPWIQQIQEKGMSGESIPWKKVHLLPDHVKFNHSAHVNKGKTCQTCHGPVETMPVVYQYNDLSMGWCVNCHRQPENNAPITCGTCHY